MLNNSLHRIEYLHYICYKSKYIPTNCFKTNDMRIGIPTEIKNNEFRVGMTPTAVRTLISHGHEVSIESNAGLGSGFTDDQYMAAGAKISPNAKQIYDNAEMIIKVKEPLAAEYDLIQEGQLIYTYFHFASSKTLTNAMLNNKSVCLAYETITDDLGRLPLLTPMSEVAGRLAAQQGAKFLESPQGGLGVLMGGVTGVSPADVMVLGGGIVGTQAAIVAAGMGAQVTIYDINRQRLKELDGELPNNITTCYSTTKAIESHLKHAHLVIGAVLVPGAKAPRLITKEHLKLMQKGAVLVDVAVDQGGCFETTRVTTHENPTYIVDHILHYAVANMPGAVPQTSTQALTNATLAYAIDLANKGWENACKQDKHLAKGLNVVNGKVTHQSVADAFSLPHTPIEKVLI